MTLLETLDSCMELDERALQDPTKENGQELADRHRELGALLEKTDEDTIRDLMSGAGSAEDTADEETVRQLLSEKQLLSVFSGKSDYDKVTMLTTFSCFMLSRRNGEKLHSGVYMGNVKKIHALVNTVFGKDPDAARGCS